MRLLDASLKDLAAGLRAGRFSPIDLWNEARAAMDAREPVLNAYKLRLDEAAERAAREAHAAFKAGRDLGILQGIPVSVKDLYGVPGFPVFAGSSKELPAKWQAAGPLVQRLLDEHAVITGKTHTVEFAFGGVGLNNHWPTPRNPWDEREHRVPGGSSSGAGVSLREGSAIVAMGTDTAGSVRLPASLTGNAGYKPTIGRWPTDGIVPLSRWFDTPGVLARTVSDAFLAAADFDTRVRPGADDAIDKAQPAKGLRIGIPGGHFWDVCDPGIEKVVREALSRLERAGHRLVDVRMEEADKAFELWSAGGTVGAELYGFLSSELPAWIERLDTNVGRRMQLVSGLAREEVLARKAAFDSLAGGTARHFEAVDVIATPTVPCPPPRIEDVRDPDGYRTHNMRLLRNTHTANQLQLCAITMPIGLDPLGLPVGLQLMGARNADDRLFAAALACEEVLSRS